MNLLQGNKALSEFVSEYMSGPHVFCDFRCARLEVRRELMARVVPLSSAVVCIESIPAYAGVVVRGYYSWCMSGSLAGQFRLWYALRVYQLMLGW